MLFFQPSGTVSCYLLWLLFSSFPSCSVLATPTVAVGFLLWLRLLAVDWGTRFFCGTERLIATSFSISVYSLCCPSLTPCSLSPSCAACKIYELLWWFSCRQCSWTL